MAPILVVHGGAGAWPEGTGAAAAGIRRALAAGWTALARDGSAIEAVELAVAALEDDPAFNAGYGSCLTSAGRVQMDASIMDGETLRAGAVAVVERVRNPIRLACRILRGSPHILFAGPDAERVAEELGCELCENAALTTDLARQRLAEWRLRVLPQAERGTDTVGAVACDANGHLAAATSTGGMTGKPPGRVGDSPLIGAGCYADDALGAVSCTGLGEAFIKLVLGKWAVDRLAAGSGPQAAASAAIELLERRTGATGGLILLSPEGEHGLARNTPAMPWGLQTQERQVVEPA